MSNILRVVRRKSHNEPADDKKAVRLSGSSLNTGINIDRSNGEIDADNPVGRTGNDWTYPDLPRGAYIVDPNVDNRYQDMTSRHLHEGPLPGRIPFMFNARTHGKLGRAVTGNPSGDIGFTVDVTGESSGGVGDLKYVPHTPIPRGSIMARAFMRTVDDAAFVPAIYVADPTRR